MSILRIKALFVMFFGIFLQSCNHNKTIEPKNLDNSLTIDFLDERYQIQGYFVPDILDPYPAYCYWDEKIGGFSVDYIGKTNELQDFWDVNNSDGFFSKYSDKKAAASNSDEIKKHIDPEKYYILASYLPSEYIIRTENDKFEKKPNAKTMFYLYVDAKWELIEELDISKLPNTVNFTALQIGLIQKYEYTKNRANFTNNYNGSFSVYVETESTTTGMSSITYQFNIHQSDVTLSLNTVHNPIMCEGKYFAKENNNLLEIYYFDEELSCISVQPKFYIEKKGEKMYIKGVGGEGTINEWIQLESSKKSN